MGGLTAGNATFVGEEGLELSPHPPLAETPELAYSLVDNPIYRLEHRVFVLFRDGEQSGA